MASFFSPPSGLLKYNIRYKLVIVEALIFVLPLFCISYIVYHGNYYLEISHLMLFSFIILLILAGLIIIRQIFERISTIATSIKKVEKGDTVTITTKEDVSELHDISLSLNNLAQKLKETTGELSQRTFELLTIKELTENAKKKLNINDLTDLILGKCMAVTGTQIGSVFMVEVDPRNKSLVFPKSSENGSTLAEGSAFYRFRVVATKGHDKELERGSYIRIDSSLAKPVVLKGKTLLIQDIEKDPRTLKANDPKYGPPSFLSMPIFIGDRLAAVMNLAHKETGQLFDSNDEQVLSIMLGEISFALENAMLHSEIDIELQKSKAHNIKLEQENEERRRVEEALRESEKKYRGLFDFLPISLFEITKEGDVITGNPTIFQTFGYTQDDFDKGLNVLRMFIPEDLERVKADIQRVLNGEKTRGIEYTMIRKDGSTFPVIILASPISYGSIPVGLRGAIIDLTERKIAEDALRESEGKLKVILESVQAGIVIIDPELHVIVDANTVAVNMIGAPKENIIGSVCHRYICPAEKGQCPITDLGQSIDKAERILITAEGENRPIIKTVVTVMLGGRKHLLESFIDITERKRAEEALKESEVKYRSLAASVASMYLVDRDCTYLFMNEGYRMRFGLSLEEIIGRRYGNFHSEENAREFEECVREVCETGKPIDWEHRSDRDGRYFLRTFSPITDRSPAGEISKVVVVSKDITELKQAEASLQKSNLSLAEAQRIAHIGNWEWNIQTNETYWSDELHRIFGTTPQTFVGTYEAFLGMIHPDDRDIVKDAIDKALNERAKAVCNHRIVRSDGSVREVHEIFEMISDDTGKAMRVIGTIQDVTERNQTERELQRARDLLIQSEKLASIGRLSAGVAHEILNPVNIISIELQLLQTMESLPPEVLEELKICMDQIKRIVAIAESLKQFSRIPEKKTVMADINGVIAHILSLYATQLKIEGIETEVQYQSDLPVIAMDREKIEQVILNLISNATSSMEGKEKKVLRITTERETMFRDRDQLKIMIADTGTGIKSEHISEIFNPFFTTKEQGKGTGLGLFISYGIIQDQGGRIWAENNEWGGASFYIELPVKPGVDRKSYYDRS